MDKSSLAEEIAYVSAPLVELKYLRPENQWRILHILDFTACAVIELMV